MLQLSVTEQHSLRHLFIIVCFFRVQLNLFLLQEEARCILTQFHMAAANNLCVFYLPVARVALSKVLDLKLLEMCDKIQPHSVHFYCISPSGCEMD